jgi:hypothetical protein
MRRQVLSHDDLVHHEFYHQTTPRKWRTSSGSGFISTNLNTPGYIPSWLWQDNTNGQAQRGYFEPEKTTSQHAWIGKKLLYWNGESLDSYVAQIRQLKYGPAAIGEFEIAQFARPNDYRIIFVDKNGNWRSNPNISYQAGRLNVLVGPDDIIQKIAYF